MSFHCGQCHVYGHILSYFHKGFVKKNWRKVVENLCLDSKEDWLGSGGGLPVESTKGRFLCW